MGLTTFPLQGQRRDDLLTGLRTIGFERRITIAFVVTANAVLIEGIFYGGQASKPFSMMKGETHHRSSRPPTPAPP
jgi:hypothetical protein